MSGRTFRLGVDTGGTFTDATLIDEATGAIRIAKVLSTPHDPSLAFLEATERILRESGVEPAAVRYVVHATTVATNAVIEGRTARTALVTTEGFRDLLEIARQTRPSLYDLQFEKPRPLVPRHLCFGVPERLDAHGAVLQPLDEAAVHEVAARLRAEEVEAVAVCLLHAYVNPEHERRVGAILRAALPEAAVSLSSEVAPEFREYVRASTTVINASLGPIVSRYLGSLERALRGRGLGGELLVMGSGGGVSTFASASAGPVGMVESGPAAGVIAATYLGGAIGCRDIISFDMGGTTAKAGLVRDGTPRVTKEYEVGAVARPGTGGGRGSGYPIRTPVIELVEIGAGGGSIAWVDSGGGLRVGPRSAGADPGPACYGRGGTEPTVTDANLVLGRLNPDFFLGGEIRLDVEAAHRAIHDRCAAPLGLDSVRVAQGIVDIADAAMVGALRLVSVQRGYDPRDFALVAFGGAGPLHANSLADTLGIPTVVVPMSPGTASALGLLVSDLKHEYTRTLVRPVAQLDPAEVECAFRELEEQGGAALAREGVSAEAVAFDRQAELRYVGQSFELPIRLPVGQVDAAALAAVRETFHAEHARAYGYSVPGEPVEVVNLRLTALGKIAPPRLYTPPAGATDAEAARKGTRAVYFAEAAEHVPCPVYDRYRLGAGARIAGPAVVEELDSTTLIRPGYAARVDHFGNLLLAR